MSTKRTGSTGLTESERLHELLYQSIKSPGLNPENTFLLLATLLEQEFPEEPGEDLKKKSRAFRLLVEAPYPRGLEIRPANKLAAIVRDFRHPHEDPPRHDPKIAKRMEHMRVRVARLLPGKAENHGGLRIEQERNTHLQSDTAERVVRRLNRDHPEIAQQVAEGQISANAAAISVGYRPRRMPVRLDSAESAARTLRRHMPPDVLKRLAELLTREPS